MEDLPDDIYPNPSSDEPSPIALSSQSKPLTVPTYIVQWISDVYYLERREGAIFNLSKVSPILSSYKFNCFSYNLFISNC